MRNLSLSTKNASKCAGWVIRRVCRMKSMHYRLLVASDVGWIAAKGAQSSKFFFRKFFFDFFSINEKVISSRS
jgi:hypothetical protein